MHSHITCITAPSPAGEEPPALGPSEVPSAAPAGNEAMRASLMRPQSARKAPPKVAGPAPAVPAGVGGAAAGRGPAAGQRRTSNMGDRPPNAGTMPGQGVRPVAVFEEGAKGDSDDDVEVSGRCGGVCTRSGVGWGWWGCTDDGEAMVCTTCTALGFPGSRAVCENSMCS